MSVTMGFVLTWFLLAVSVVALIWTCGGRDTYYIVVPVDMADDDAIDLIERMDPEDSRIIEVE